jgi:hypothetical protein
VNNGPLTSGTSNFQAAKGGIGIGKVQVGAQVTANNDGVTGGVAKGGVGAGAYVGTGNGTQTTYATPSLSQLVGAASKALEKLTPSKDQK